MADLTHINYTENLFQAIDTIVAERIRQQLKDITVVATIVEDIQRDRGVYMVTEDNHFIYTATSQYPYYNKNDQVYVLKTAMGENIILNRYTFDKNLSVSPDTLNYITSIKKELSPDKLAEITTDLTYVKNLTESINIADLTVMHDQIAAINVDEINQAISSLSTMAAKLIELESSLTAQTAQLTELTTRINNLDNEMDTAARADELSVISSNLSTLQTNLTNLTSSVTQLSESQTSISAKLIELDSQVATLVNTNEQEERE